MNLHAAQGLFKSMKCDFYAVNKHVLMKNTITFCAKDECHKGFCLQACQRMITGMRLRRGCSTNRRW